MSQPPSNLPTKPQSKKALKDLEKQFFGFSYQHVHIRKLSELIFFLNSNRIIHSYVSQDIPDFFSNTVNLFFAIQPEIWNVFNQKEDKGEYSGLADFLNQ